MKYVEKNVLYSRGAVDDAPPEEVQGILLRGEKSIAHWEEGHSSYGNDYIELFPAVYDSKRCFVRRASWQAAEGYSACGTSEQIISMKEGCELLVEHGCFDCFY